MNITKYVVGVVLAISLMVSSVGTGWALSGASPDSHTLQVVCSPDLQTVSESIPVGSEATLDPYMLQVLCYQPSENLLGTGDQFPEMESFPVNAEDMTVITEEIMLSSVTPVTPGSQTAPLFGKISLAKSTNAVPEPSSMILVGLGVLGLCGLLRKRLFGR